MKIKREKYKQTLIDIRDDVSEVKSNVLTYSFAKAMERAKHIEEYLTDMIEEL